MSEDRNQNIKTNQQKSNFIGILRGCNEAEKSKSPKGISKTYTKSMPIPNFNNLTQLGEGRGICDEQTQKIFGAEKGGAMGLKSGNSRKARLRSLSSLHSKFQISSSIWKRDREGINLKYKKTSLKNPHLQAVRVTMSLKNRSSQKSHIYNS